MFRMEIETGGAAFKNPETGGEDKTFEGNEISRIMRKVVAELRKGKESGSIMDLNGNKVGYWTREDEE